MSGDNEATGADTKETSNNDGRQQGRQRSTIGFPYNDLNSAIEMTQAIHNQVGLGECDDDQLAAWTEQSPRSSGYRAQVSATKMFGLIESTGNGRYQLSDLGRMIVDPRRDRAAKTTAFLNVPLYSAVFEKYKGGVIPPAAALERDMESLGVATKMKDRARRVFERAAEQGGFFEHGKNRLVTPGIAMRDHEAALTPDTPKLDSVDNERKEHSGKGGSGDGTDFGDLHPFIQGLLKTLPPPESEWAVDARAKWLQTAANIFDLIYKGEGGIEIKSAVATRSPRPEER